MQALNSLNRYAPHALALLRIVTALTFLTHGTQKLFGFPQPPSWGMPAAFALTWYAAILEVAGGALLAIGYWIGHAPKGFYPLLNGGEPALLFCFIFFYLFFAGPGSFALDNRAK